MMWSLFRSLKHVLKSFNAAVRGNLIYPKKLPFLHWLPECSLNCTVLSGHPSCLPSMLSVYLHLFAIFLRNNVNVSDG